MGGTSGSPHGPHEGLSAVLVVQAGRRGPGRAPARADRHEGLVVGVANVAGVGGGVRPVQAPARLAGFSQNFRSPKSRGLEGFFFFLKEKKRKISRRLYPLFF